LFFKLSKAPTLFFFPNIIINTNGNVDSSVNELVLLGISKIALQDKYHK